MGAVLLYDADCGFCRWSASKVLAWDLARALRAVPLRSAEADDLLREMAPDRRDASWHLVLAGTTYSGGAAVAPLARLLPAGRPIALLVEAAPGLTDRAYRWVARNRGRLGRALGARACAVDPRTGAATRWRRRSRA